MKDEFNLVPRIESVRRLGRPSNDKSRPLLIKIDDEGNSTHQLIRRANKNHYITPKARNLRQKKEGQLGPIHKI